MPITGQTFSRVLSIVSRGDYVLRSKSPRLVCDIKVVTLLSHTISNDFGSPSVVWLWFNDFNRNFFNYLAAVGWPLSGVR